MNAIFCKRLPIYFLTAVFSLWQLPASAIPKAAEDENAEVATGTDVARPKVTQNAVKKDVGKKVSSPTKGKPHGKASASKKPKTNAPRK